MSNGNQRLAGKTALIFGAGSLAPGWGIGKATSVLFGRNGANVVAVDVNAEAAEETRRLVEGEGAQCVALSADVASGDQIKRAADAAIARFGQIDILVNNVGIGKIGGPVELAEKDWDNVFDVNVRGPFLACKHVIPHMEERGGSIISVSSVAARRHVGYPHMAYAASKAALEQLSRMIAVQYAAKKIRSNCVVPGLIDTPRIAHTVASAFAADAEEAKKKRALQSPTGTLGSAWDIAQAALYLASDDSSYVTGTEILVDGGITSKYS